MGFFAGFSSEHCPLCGCWTDLFVCMPSRADELLKVKGMLINPESVIDLLLANGQIDEFQFVIDREDKDDALSGDRFRLLVDTGPKTDLENLSESVRLAIGVRPEIEITPRAKIFDPEKSLKAKRLLDLRKSP